MNKILFIFLFLTSYTLYCGQVDILRLQIATRSKQLHKIVDKADINSDNVYIAELIHSHINNGISSQEYADITEWAISNNIDIDNKYFNLTLSYLREIYENTIKLERTVINEDFKHIYIESGISEDFKLYLDELNIVDSNLLDEYYSIYLERGGINGVKSDHLRFLGYSKDNYNPSTHFSVSINPEYNPQYLRVKTLSTFHYVDSLKNLSLKNIEGIRSWSNYLCTMDIWEIVPLLLIDHKVESILNELYMLLSRKTHYELKEFSVNYNFPINELITLSNRLKVLFYWTNSPEFRFYREVVK